MAGKAPLESERGQEFHLTPRPQEQGGGLRQQALSLAAKGLPSDGFKALSLGIGIGALRPVDRGQQSSQGPQGAANSWGDAAATI